MESVTDLAKKAFYFGVGMAAYAGEQVSAKVSELQAQAAQVADDLIRRGEMTTEEATRWMNELAQQGQQSPPDPNRYPERPEKIEILSIEDVDEPSDS